MTQEDKDLLLKDLSTRLPYGVKISIPDLWTQEMEIEILDEIFKGDDGLYRVNSKGQCIEYVKPYLFPMSSMTVEQRWKVQALLPDKCEISFTDSKIKFYDADYHAIKLEQFEKLFKFFNMWHIDYRGLIPMGLANDATNLNIY